MTPIQQAALEFVGDVRADRATGRIQQRDLRDTSEPMRQAFIDLAMMEPALVDVDGDRVFLTEDGRRLMENRICANPDTAKRNLQSAAPAVQTKS